MYEHSLSNPPKEGNSDIYLDSRYIYTHLDSRYMYIHLDSRYVYTYRF